MRHCPRTTRRAAQRGFTLTELMVSTVVTAIVLAGAMAAMIANQRQFASHANVNAVQANVRAASGQIERALARAGFGMDPNYALEPRALDASGNEVANGARDNSGPNGSDELVVQYADPGFRRTVTGAAPGGFTLGSALAAGDSLQAGQRLLVLCAGAADFAYVTVASYNATSLAVSLSTVAPAPFNQQAKLGNDCFGNAGTVIRRIERRHYFIAWFDEPGGARPALMVLRGLDLDADGTSDELPDDWPAALPVGGSTGDAELVALDIEQLQVAYVMNRPSTTLATRYGITSGPDGNGNFVFGDSTAPDSPSSAAPVWSGTATAPSPLGPPLLNDPGCNALLEGDSHCGYGGARRFTGHPGNVRSVRFTLVGRSSQAIPEIRPVGPEADDGLIENKPASTGAQLTRHRRVRLSNTVTLKNVFLRKHFTPPTENFDGA